MKKIIILLALLCLSFTSSAQNKNNWELVYHNDKDGKTIEGEIDNLVEAIRNGESVRIYWSSQRKNDKTKKVEHLTEAKFMTVLSDTIVFAQIDPIIGQIPNYDLQIVRLNENLEWFLIAATNGKSDTMMRNISTGEIIGHKSVPFEIKWFIKK